MKANLLTIAQIENEDPSQESSVQQQAQLARELAFEQEMMLDRETRIKQIEGDILDINQIMRELGSLVHQQGETIGEMDGGCVFLGVLIVCNCRYDRKQYRSCSGEC